MSQQIPTHYAVQYASNIELLLQQKGSRLRDTVTPKSITGAKSAVPVDQIGKVEATKRTTRYPVLTPADTPAERPWVYPSDYDWNDLIDSIDKLRVVTDPQSSYVTNGGYAMGRAMDNEIVGAFFNDRKTGEAGATTTSFLAANVVAVNYGAAGAVGLTVAKLRQAKKLLLAAEVDMDMDPITIPVTAAQHDNLLSEIQITSLDFNERPVLVEGTVTRFLGFNFKHTELLAVDASSYRQVPVYAKSGMVLAIWNDISTDISIRKDLAGLPVQVYVYGTFGATRLEEKKVVKILCAE
ncbi:MAG: phage capsid protein [Thiobacillus sp.]